MSLFSSQVLARDVSVPQRTMFAERRREKKTREENTADLFSYAAHNIHINSPQFRPWPIGLSCVLCLQCCAPPMSIVVVDALFSLIFFHSNNKIKHASTPANTSHCFIKQKKVQMVQNSQESLARQGSAQCSVLSGHETGQEGHPSGRRSLLGADPDPSVAGEASGQGPV